MMSDDFRWSFTDLYKNFVGFWSIWRHQKTFRNQLIFNYTVVNFERAKSTGCKFLWNKFLGRYSLMQKNVYTFAIVYSSKYVSVFLYQTLPEVIFAAWACPVFSLLLSSLHLSIENAECKTGRSQIVNCNEMHQSNKK